MTAAPTPRTWTKEEIHRLAPDLETWIRPGVPVLPAESALLQTRLELEEARRQIVALAPPPDFFGWVNAESREFSPVTPENFEDANDWVPVFVAGGK